MYNLEKRTRYINVITEAERRDALHVLNAIGVRVAIMEARGYSVADCDRFVFKTLYSLERGTLDEGLLDAVGGLFKWASNSKLLQPIQSWLGKKLAMSLGLNPEGLFFKAFVNIIENMDVKTVQTMFSGNGCKTVVAKVVGSFQEACVEHLLQLLGMAPTSALGYATHEILLAMFAEEGPLVNLVSEKVCKFSISSFFPGGTSNAKDLIGKVSAEIGTPAAPAVQVPAV